MEHIDIKIIASIIGIILLFLGFAPYLIDTFKGKTKPHVFSWFIWTMIAVIGYLLQINNGAGLSSLITLFTALVLLSIFILALRNGNKDIKTTDKILLAITLSIIPFWLITKNSVVSVILLTSIDMLGFVPTIRKSWNNPYSETLSTYFISAVRHIFAIIALANYNFVTLLWSSAWIMANILFVILLLARRPFFANKNGKK